MRGSCTSIGDSAPDAEARSGMGDQRYVSPRPSTSVAASHTPGTSRRGRTASSATPRRVTSLRPTPRSPIGALKLLPSEAFHLWQGIHVGQELASPVDFRLRGCHGASQRRRVPTVSGPTPGWRAPGHLGRAAPSPALPLYGSRVAPQRLIRRVLTTVGLYGVCRHSTPRWTLLARNPGGDECLSRRSRRSGGRSASWSTRPASGPAARPAESSEVPARASMSGRRSTSGRGRRG